MSFQPVIKWSGSKRSQCAELIKYFPHKFDTFYEPFVGGGSVFRQLLESDIQFNHIVCSDLNTDLINLWNIIKSNPQAIVEHYEKLWKELNQDDDLQRKKDYFNMVRARYNENHNPLDFMFIMRTTTNGMPRYNANGDFNNSFHVTRNGIEPDSLTMIIREWSNLINKHNIEFKACDYHDIVPNKNDFMYLDPPYANTKGMYFSNFSEPEFFRYLKDLQCQYMFSFDGKSGKEDNTFDVPDELYTVHKYIKSGNSSFKRVIGKDKNAQVYESLYIKYQGL